MDNPGFSDDFSVSEGNSSLPSLPENVESPERLDNGFAAWSKSLSNYCRSGIIIPCSCYFVYCLYEGLWCNRRCLLFMCIAWCHWVTEIWESLDFHKKISQTCRQVYIILYELFIEFIRGFIDNLAKNNVHRLILVGSCSHLITCRKDNILCF